MRLTIDITEEDYNFIKKQIADGITNPLKVCIANGVPTEQEPKTDTLKQIREEITYAMDREPAWKGQDNYIGGLQIACSIIDKYR